MESINQLRAHAQRQEVENTLRQQQKASAELNKQNNNKADKDRKLRRSKRAEFIGYVYDEADSLPSKTQFKVCFN